VLGDWHSAAIWGTLGSRSFVLNGTVKRNMREEHDWATFGYLISPIWLGMNWKLPGSSFDDQRIISKPRVRAFTSFEGGRQIRLRALLGFVDTLAEATLDT
jgi:hypothetical protein